MDAPKFTPVVPPSPAAVVAPAAATASLYDQIGTLTDDLAKSQQQLAAARAILKDLVAAGVLTDGFMTVGVGQCLLNQAEAAKKFLETHP